MALCAALSFFASFPAHAFLGPSVNHPERHWQEISTPHFKIHYYQGFDQLAKLAARVAEEGFEKITADLGVAPQEKISLIINEDEFWNGFAEPARNRIVLDPRFALEAPIGINRFLLHEMTHIFNFLAVQRGLFGSNLFKSAGLPAWFAEGLAQYEAEYWASENDRMLRLHLLNRSLLTPAERNAFTALSGKGSEGYNEGYALVKFIFESYGREKLPELLQTYRNLSGDFYQAIQLTFGKPLLQIEADWRQALEERTREQIEARSETLSQAQALIPFRTNRTWYLPKPSPDGKWLAYQSTGGYPLIRGQIYPVQPLMIANLNQLKAYGEQERQKENQKKSPQPEPTQPPEIQEPGFKTPANPPEKLELDKIQNKLVDRVTDYAWAPDSQHLAYTLLIPDQFGNTTRTVQILPLQTEKDQLKALGEAETLLPGKTLHSPTWSPAGDKLALVLEENQRDSIIIFDLLNQKIEKTLVTAPDLRQYQALQWSPDGQKIVVEVYLPGEGQNLLLLDAEGQAPSRQLTESSTLYADKQAIWAPDSQSLYFISTRNGFANLYRHKLESRQTEPLSDVYTGLEVPALGQDSLYFIRHHAQGTSLERVALQDLKPGKAEKEATDMPYLADLDKDLTPTGETSPAQAYLPWIGLEVVVPVLSLDEKGDQVGFLAQASDLLQRHSLNVLALYGLVSSRIGFSTAYVNHMFDTSFALEVSDSPLLSFATDGSAYFITRDQQVAFSITRPLFNPGTGDTYATRIRRFASLEISASHQTNLRSELGGLIDDKLLRQGWNNSINLSWNANESIRNNDGIRYNLNLSAGGPWLGSQYSFLAANGNFRHYIPVFGDHTLAYRLDATAMTGDTRPALLGGPPLSNLLVLNFQNIIPLRGFKIAELQGSMMAAASLEYRFPLIKDWNFNLGGHYLENLTAAAFVDAGDAWFPSKRTPYPHIATGIELRSEAVLNHRNSFNLYIGMGKALLGKDIGPYDRGPEFYGGFANIF